jgi:DNA-binding IclR family transcriptional regulator
MEFSTEYWKTHNRGVERRRDILATLQRNHYMNLSGLTLSDIAKAVGLSDRQVRRHLHYLILEGRIYRDGRLYFYRYNANIWDKQLNFSQEKLWN